MKISAITYQQNYPKTSFEGLTKKMKKQIYIDGQKDIEEILENHPTVKPIVGQLPAYIINKLPSGPQRHERILEIYDAFDKAVLAIRNFYPDETCKMDEITKRRPREAVETIKSVLLKNDIIAPWDNFDIKYIDKGGLGAVYKLEGLQDYKNEDEYVIKVYHIIKGKDWQPFKSHGCFAELNSATYWTEQEGHDTQRGKFFFGSLGSGYLVEKYLDEDVRIPKRIVDEYKYGIKCTDEEKLSGHRNIVGYNCIKGYNYDFGGLRVINRFKNGNKVARYYQKKIRNTKPEERLKVWAENFKTKKDGENKFAGLAIAIKYFGDEKTELIDKCLELNNVKVNRALAYTLKYLPHVQSMEYFEKLVKTDDALTQIILFNEIPLLSKRALGQIKDDLGGGFQEEKVFNEDVYDFYQIAIKYALPDSVEHLANYVHLLPKTLIPGQYKKLVSINSFPLKERLLYKYRQLPNDFQATAAKLLAEKIIEPGQTKKLIDFAQQLNPEDRNEVYRLLDIIKF